MANGERPTDAAAGPEFDQSSEQDRPVAQPRGEHADVPDPLDAVGPLPDQLDSVEEVSERWGETGSGMNPTG